MLKKEMESPVLKELEDETMSRKYTTPAKRVLEKLAPMASHVDIYQKRWFWELLQNACDYHEKVKIELEITPDFLYFRHNGTPFKIGQVLNLILPDSDKDEDEDPEVIGQYGSGFISTHILSTDIMVSGNLLTKQNKEYSFSFTLDRSNSNEKTLLSKALSD